MHIANGNAYIYMWPFWRTHHVLSSNQMREEGMNKTSWSALYVFGCGSVNRKLSIVKSLINYDIFEIYSIVIVTLRLIILHKKQVRVFFAYVYLFFVYI